MTKGAVWFVIYRPSELKVFLAKKLIFQLPLKPHAAWQYNQTHTKKQIWSRMCASEQNLLINTMKVKQLVQKINLLYAITADLRLQYLISHMEIMS